MINAMQLIIAISKRMLQPKLAEEWIVYLKSSNQSFQRAATRSVGMFCMGKVLKVTDWVMYGIFAYWPSSSLIVNKELNIFKCNLNLQKTYWDSSVTSTGIAIHFSQCLLEMLIEGGTNCRVKQLLPEMLTVLQAGIVTSIPMWAMRCR